MSFFCQYKVNINTFNVQNASPTDYSIVKHTNVHKCTWSNYASVYFDLGLLIKALEIFWAKPMEYAMYLSM